MPFRATPRLCAECGLDLDIADDTVTLDDIQTGDRRFVHRACFSLYVEPYDPRQVALEDERRP